MKQILLPLLLLNFVCWGWSQSAEDVDRLLASEAVDYATATRFVLLAAELVAADADPLDCYGQAVDRRWLAAGRDPAAPIRLNEFSDLCVRAFGLQTGVLYRLLPGPRYAYRELVYRKMIQGRSDPGQFVPGDRVVRILGRILDTREATL